MCLTQYNLPPIFITFSCSPQPHMDTIGFEGPMLATRQGMYRAMDQPSNLGHCC